MKNNIIYSVLFIIFTVLIIYGIININNDRKLNNNIESFQNNFFNKLFKEDIVDNTIMTKDFANGTWSIPESEVDNNYNIKNLMTINIRMGSNLNNFSVIDNARPTGTGTYTGFKQDIFDYGTIDYNGTTYIINYVLNDNITAISTKNKLYTIHMKILNKFNKENEILTNRPYYTAETINAIISIFNSNLLVTKFASYKVYNGKVGGEVYRILKSKDIFIDQAPPLFDYHTYNVLMNNYKYPEDIYTITYTSTSDNSTLDLIRNTYDGGKLYVSIQRVFYSPTGTSIKTKASDPTFINILQGNNIANNIIICPFKEDQTVNSLENFFKPKGTIFYIYKLNETKSSYKYANPSQTYSTSGLKLNNGAQNMYGSNNLLIDDLTSVQLVSDNIYNMNMVGEYPSNLNSPTTIPFNDILNAM